MVARLASRRVPLLLAMLTLSACGSPEADTPAAASTTEREEPLALAAIQHVVPLRFVAPVNSATDTNTATLAQLEETVRQTNLVWRDTGVQFVLQSFTRVAMPTFMGDLYETPTYEAPSATWAQVRPDILKVFPNAAATFPTPKASRSKTD